MVAAARIFGRELNSDDGDHPLCLLSGTFTCLAPYQRQRLAEPCRGARNTAVTVSLSRYHSQAVTVSDWLRALRIGARELTAIGTSNVIGAPPRKFRGQIPAVKQFRIPCK